MEPCNGICKFLLNRNLDGREWLHQKPEQRVAAALLQTLNRPFGQKPDDDERNFMVLMFTMLKIHSYRSDDSEEDRRLMAAIDRRVERLLRTSGISVNNQTDLVSQLFVHLAPAAVLLFRH